MAVLIEAISVVVRADALLTKFAGGWDAFKARVPNQTLCADNDIARVITPRVVERMTVVISSDDMQSVKNILDANSIDYEVIS